VERAWHAFWFSSRWARTTTAEISRIREEAVGRGIRSGVIRTVGSTGGVITSAGPHLRASCGPDGQQPSATSADRLPSSASDYCSTRRGAPLTVPAMAVIVAMRIVAGGQEGCKPRRCAGSQCTTTVESTELAAAESVVQETDAEETDAAELNGAVDIDEKTRRSIRSSSLRCRCCTDREPVRPRHYRCCGELSRRLACRPPKQLLASPRELSLAVLLGTRQAADLAASGDRIEPRDTSTKSPRSVRESLRSLTSIAF